MVIHAWESADTGGGPSPLCNEAIGGRGPTAFVLGGGGSYGAVQVGMLRALLEAGIHPDLIVGTSIGALNGAYLAGHPDSDGVETLGRMWSSVRRTDVFRIDVRNLLGVAIGYRDHLFKASGLRGIISRADLGFERLDEALLPIHAVATDLMSGQATVLSTGDVTEALLASSAIPGVFPPVTVGGRILVDGGIVANLPVSQAIELGATRLFVLPATSDEVRSIPARAIDILQRSMTIATGAVTLGALTRASAFAEIHVLPVPISAQPSLFDFRETKVLMEGAYMSTATWLYDSDRELAP